MGFSWPWRKKTDRKADSLNDSVRSATDRQDQSRHDLEMALIELRASLALKALRRKVEQGDD